MSEEQEYTKQTWRDRMLVERIHPLLDKWVPRLGLTHWRFRVSMAEVIDEDPKVEATCDVFTTYCRQIRLTIADRIVDDPPNLEMVIVHELIHVHLDELAQYAYQQMPESAHDWFTRLVEIAVSDLSNVFLDLKLDEAPNGP